ncbi:MULTISPECIES: hypothetical protein [Micromonospora]|uniref:Uncharacterized protein n=1 Tax=Micromonospora carbonacea TaxID=47853 RepID=A0A7H8XGS1_9ACTN|nr:hypothetical protein [Micromonospora carbonacea]MBB5828783.1 hypothetical protein [Micromonospora carbonacea]QLD23658.1 hypothetical protein HXZ27_05055 [Micromonospora carbonacea]
MSGTRAPIAAFGSAAVASYVRFCWSFSTYSSCSGFSSVRALLIARVAAARAS